MNDQKAWEREESKVVRPFRSLEDYLSDAELRLHESGEFFAGPLVVAEGVDTTNILPAIKLTAPPVDLETLVGMAKKDLSLIVSIEDRVLKSSKILHTTPMSDFEAGVLELGDEAKDAANWYGDTRVHVALILNRDRRASPGLAYRAGSWLARKVFQLGKSSSQASFNITPVDEAWFVGRGLPANTAYYIELIGDNFNVPCAEMPGLVSVHMAAPLHAALARDDSSPTSRAFSRSIFVDVVSTIISVGVESLDDDEIGDGTILKVSIERLAKESGFQVSQIVQYAKDGGTKLKTIAQAAADLNRAMTGAVSRKVMQ